MISKFFHALSQSRLFNPAEDAPPPLASAPSVVRFSYMLVAVALAAAAWLHLGTLIITTLFSLFALHLLNFVRRRWLAAVLFIVVFAAAFYGFYVFLHLAARQLPRIVGEVIPTIAQHAQRFNLNIPVVDFEGTKEVLIKVLRENLGGLANFFKLATRQFIMLVVGIVIAMGIFLQRQPPPAAPATSAPDANLYTCHQDAIRRRFSSLFRSFETVMGAQLIISAINTLLTACFFLVCHLLGIGLPYPGFLIPLTFLCGVLPIVGNIISNCFIVGTALTVSPELAVAALVFLVLVHKLEYFLNSQIIGSRIRQPMWLTLIGLIVGEYLMGIPGVILAPVVLHYIKSETSCFPAPASPKAHGETLALASGQPHDPAKAP